MNNCIFCGREYSNFVGFRRYTLRKGKEYRELFVCQDCQAKIEQLKRIDKRLWTEEALSLKKMARSAVGNLDKLSIAVFATLLSFGM